MERLHHGVIFVCFYHAAESHPSQCQATETDVLTQWSRKAITCQHNTTATSKGLPNA